MTKVPGFRTWALVIPCSIFNIPIRGVAAPAYSLRLSALPAQDQRPISVKSAVQNGLVFGSAGAAAPYPFPFVTFVPFVVPKPSPSEEADRSVRAPLGLRLAICEICEICGPSGLGCPSGQGGRATPQDHGLSVEFPSLRLARIARLRSARASTIRNFSATGFLASRRR